MLKVGIGFIGPGTLFFPCSAANAEFLTRSFLRRADEDEKIWIIFVFSFDSIRFYRM